MVIAINQMTCMPAAVRRMRMVRATVPVMMMASVRV